MMQEQWRALELMYKAKKTRAIGVSNFCPACLECIAKTSTIVPAVNQVDHIILVFKHYASCVQLLYHVGMANVSDPTGALHYNKARGIQVDSESVI